jgi:hypothetical protein
MTNPYLTEQHVLGACASLLTSGGAVLCGNAMPRPTLVVELTARVARDVGLPTDVAGEAALVDQQAAARTHVRTALLHALRDANRAQPRWSAVLSQHVWLCVPGTWPRTLKGALMRRAVEAALTTHSMPHGAVCLVGWNERGGAHARRAPEGDEPWVSGTGAPPTASIDGRSRRNEKEEKKEEEEEDSGEDDDTMEEDSLQMVAGSGARRGAQATGDGRASGGGRGGDCSAGGSDGASEGLGVVFAHVYLVSMVLTVLHHLPRTREGCANGCGVGMGTLELLGEAVAMPAFATLAGVRDRQVRARTMI